MNDVEVVISLASADGGIPTEFHWSVLAPPLGNLYPTLMVFLEMIIA